MAYTLLGHVHIVNSCLLSKLWYISYFVSWPPWFLKRLKQLVTTFLWNSKRPQVAYATLCSAQEDGGLGLIDPGLQTVAHKGWWLQRMSQPGHTQWMSLALDNFRHRFAPGGWSISILLTNTRSQALQHYGLWRDIFQAWQALEGVSHQDPLTFDDDNPFHEALVAEKDIESYTIRSGRLFLAKKSFPMPQSKWLQVVPGLVANWGGLWKKFKGVRKFLPPRQSLLWWRFLQHNLMTGVRLHHMNPAVSEVCHICNSGRETLDHLFWQCNKVRQFWGNVFQLFQLLAPGHQVPGPELEIVVNPFCVFPNSLFPVVVSVFGSALWAIWKMYLGVVFEGSIFNHVALYEYFCSVLSSHIFTLYKVACKRKKVGSFVKVWCKSPLVSCSNSSIKIAL